MEMKFENNSFGQRLKSMVIVDFRRMFTMRLFYIMAGICLAVPVLILVMTTVMDGSVSVDPETGVETVMKGFDNVWQIVGTANGVDSPAGMDMMSMCNMNLIYFGFAALVGLFVSADFKSGYAKNLFTVRAKKNDYVISKTVICIVAGVFMMLAFIVGTLLGGAISGLPFELEAITTGNIMMCLLSKMLLTAVFVPIFLVVSVIAKQKTWLTIVGSFVVSMLLFTIIPLLTPLNATITNVVLCLVGGVLFSILLGMVSSLILSKCDLI